MGRPGVPTARTPIRRSPPGLSNSASRPLTVDRIIRRPRARTSASTAVSKPRRSATVPFASSPIASAPSMRGAPSTTSSDRMKLSPWPRRRAGIARARATSLKPCRVLTTDQTLSSAASSSRAGSASRTVNGPSAAPSPDTPSPSAQHTMTASFTSSSAPSGSRKSTCAIRCETIRETRPPCPRTPVHLLPGPNSGRGRGPARQRREGEGYARRRCSPQFVGDDALPIPRHDLSCDRQPPHPPIPLPLAPPSPARGEGFFAAVMNSELPPWAEYALLPLVNLPPALVLSAPFFSPIGHAPLPPLAILVAGALGNQEAIGFTLYYATSFIFTGLAVAIPFHAGLFNIGGEGQAMLGGIGAALGCLGLGRAPPWLLPPPAPLAPTRFGAALALIPAGRQGRRAGHRVA